MKKLQLLTIFLLFLASLNAQDDEVSIDINSYDQPFLYLKDGTLLLEDEYFVKKRILFGESYFLNNGEKINLNKIKYIQLEEKLFGVINQSFSARIEIGKYNIFRSFSRGHSYYNDNGILQSTPSSKSYFYSSGFGDLKGLSYKNLKKDLSVFPEYVTQEEQKVVLDILQKGRKRDKTRTRLIWSGVGVIAIGGLIYQYGGKKEGPADPPPPGTIVIVDPLVSPSGYAKHEVIGLSISTLGLGISITGLVLGDERKYYIDAVKSYNNLFR